MEGESIGVRFRMINNAIRRYVDRNSEYKKEIDNITCSNGWIISHMCHMEEQGQDVYQRDFEEKFGITRSTVSKVLTLLEKKGFIERTSVSHDGRMKKITLTDRAREIGRQWHKDTEKTEKQLTKDFTPEEIETLCGYLDRIEKNLEEKNVN